jgi:hypothetical protein
MSYHASKIHTTNPRRKLSSKDKVMDTMFIGADSNRSIKTMSKWVANRASEWSNAEDWEDY